MYQDKRYTDNVVLKKDALQELLTEIKNYPIIDIDYIEEDEIDIDLASKGTDYPGYNADPSLDDQTIWKNYTGGVPCIRITYGNDSTTKGKVAYDNSQLYIVKESLTYPENDNSANSVLVGTTYKTSDTSNGVTLRNVVNIIRKQMSENLSRIAELNKNIIRYNKVREENIRLKNLKINEVKTYIDSRVSINSSVVTDIRNAVNDVNITYEQLSKQVDAMMVANLINDSTLSYDLSLTDIITIEQDELVAVDSTNQYYTIKRKNGDTYNFKIPAEIIEDESNLPLRFYLFKDYQTALNKITLLKANVESARRYALATSTLDKASSINEAYDALEQVINILQDEFNNYQLWLYEIQEHNQEPYAQSGPQFIATIDTIEDYFNKYLKFEIDRKIQRAEEYLNTYREEQRVREKHNTTLKENIAELEDNIEVPSSLNFAGVKYVKVGSSIQWDKNLIGVTYNPSRNEGSFIYPEVDDSSLQRNGHFRVTINGHTYEIGIKGFEQSDNSDLKTTASIIPNTKYTSASSPGHNLGSNNLPWHQIYGDEGYFSEIHIGNITIGGSSGNNGGPTPSFLGQSGWTNQLSGVLEFGTVSGTTFTPKVKINNNDNDGITGTTNGDNLPTTISKNTSASIYTTGGICAEYNIWAKRVFNAVFNDYAECRSTIDLTPGHVVIDQDDGSLKCSFARLQPGAQVISDTYGHLMGSTETAKTPIAVAGRVLVYTYQSRENYHSGMAVCSAPDGTVDIMTREEIRDYPDCIVGIVSEIPQYEFWGSNNVKVDGRIWIKVK